MVYKISSKPWFGGDARPHRGFEKDVRFFDKTWWTVGNTGPRETSTTGNSCGVFLDLLFPCRLATYSSKRPRIQLFGAVGWQPTAIKGLGCRRCRATYSNKRARMQLFDVVGFQPAAVQGLGCSYLTL